MKKLIATSAVSVVTAVAFAAVPAAAPAHRNGCHAKRACPSDHATYKWRSKLCVKPTSPKRTASFKTKARYAGLTYYCK